MAAKLIHFEARPETDLPAGDRAARRPDERESLKDKQPRARLPNEPKRLPPLIALSYFEVAARTRSFAAAAKELHVTPAAISHQIKALEEHIGARLFVRQSRKVTLTPVAWAALPALKEGFVALANAAEIMRSHSEAKWAITVCAEPLFATKWLVPRLHRFYALWPEAEVRLQASLGSVDTLSGGTLNESSFRQAGIDISVRFGFGDYPRLETLELLKVTLVAVCSPDLDAVLPFRSPEDLLKKPLLSDSTPYRSSERFGWAEWFHHLDVRNFKPSRVRQFGNGLLGLEAALTGQGVLLACDHLVRPEVAMGKLVVAYDHAMPCPFAYHVVCVESALERPIVQAFRRWLLEEASIPG
jgi:LysR family transcriptional regulator, glycine cleavage system transcriptional activator